MEERKTAAIILSILALIVIFYTVILPEIQFRSRHTLSFKGCSVHYQYQKEISTPDIYRAAQNELALCLCTVYRKSQDTAVSKKIVTIYKEYGTTINRDSAKSSAYQSLDSVLKYRKMAFDTVILVD